MTCKSCRTRKGRDLVALSDALSALATLDEGISQVVELRFFGGLTVEETAEALNVKPKVVMRELEDCEGLAPW